MKKIIVLFLLTLTFTKAAPQNALSQEDKIFALAKTWGFLKYFNPGKIQSGKEWDAEFVKPLPLLDAVNSKKELNIILLNWVETLSPSNTDGIRSKESQQYVEDLVKSNFDTTLFEKAFLLKLSNQNINTANKSSYIGYSNIGIPEFNEELYADNLYPNKNYRILGMCRVWNMVEYFYPYKKIIDNNWDDVFRKHIALFAAAKDSFEYARAIYSFVSNMDDTHGFVINNQKNYDPLGNLYLPFRLKMINDTVLVSEGFSEGNNLSRANGIELGDILLNIDGVETKELIKNIMPYVCASNEASKNRTIAYHLTKSFKPVAEIEVLRGDKRSVVFVNRYALKELIQDNHSENKKNKDWESINDNIGLIRLQHIDKSGLEKAVENLKKHPNIIIDLRRISGKIFPEDIAKNFSTKNATYFNYFITNQNKIGTFIQSGNYSIKKSKQAYTGNLIVLINENVQSYGETIAMVFKAIPKVVFIGGPTAGANGDVAKLSFPGGYQFRMSAAGIYYPDGSQVQRIGIVPDILIQPTVAGIKNNIDEVLDYAIQYSSNKKPFPQK